MCPRLLRTSRTRSSGTEGTHRYRAENDPFREKCDLLHRPAQRQRIEDRHHHFSICHTFSAANHSLFEKGRESNLTRRLALRLFLLDGRAGFFPHLLECLTGRLSRFLKGLAGGLADLPLLNPLSDLFAAFLHAFVGAGK